MFDPNNLSSQVTAPSSGEPTSAPQPAALRSQAPVPTPDVCPSCRHSLKDNMHGFDQNDAWMDGDKLIHSGRCTYCAICNPNAAAPVLSEEVAVAIARVESIQKKVAVGYAFLKDNDEIDGLDQAEDDLKWCAEQLGKALREQSTLIGFSYEACAKAITSKCDSASEARDIIRSLPPASARQAMEEALLEARNSAYEECAKWVERNARCGPYNALGAAEAIRELAAKRATATRGEIGNQA